VRCAECLDEIPLDAERFAVLKERTLTADEVLSDDPFVAALAKWQQVFVCRDCSGWHRDAIELTAEEAGEA
jgi:hypothetical protein